MTYTGTAQETARLPKLDSHLASLAIWPDDHNYRHFRSSYMRKGSPALVLRASNESDVRAALRYVTEARASCGLPFAVRSGGHGISGQSTNDGGIVLDLSDFRSIEIANPEKRLIRVKPGAVWGEVAGALAKSDLALTSGNFGGTGVGGLAGSGGVGYFVRHQGLTIDRIRGARLVTANGDLHEVDAEKTPDLFWAIRGGASQVGVVTEYLLEAESLPRSQVIHQQVRHVTTDLVAYIEAWGELMRTAPRAFTSFLMLHGQETSALVTSQNVWWGADSEAAMPWLERFVSLSRVIDQQARIAPYPSVVVGGRHHHYGQQDIKMRAALVDRIDRASAEALRATLCSPLTAVAELRSMGGAVNDVPPEASAWAHRHQEALMAIWTYPEPVEEIDKVWAPVEALATGTYGFYTSDTRASSAALAWPAQTGERLRQIAQTFDPEGVFRAGLSVRG